MNANKIIVENIDYRLFYWIAFEEAELICCLLDAEQNFLHKKHIKDSIEIKAKIQRDIVVYANA